MNRRLDAIICMLFALAISACSSVQSEPEPIAPPTKLIKPQPCTAMPPIHDTSKLEASLRARGIITSDMSEEEAKVKLAEYISQRRKAFDACRKGK